jgi:hypothetical protein
MSVLSVVVCFFGGVAEGFEEAIKVIKVTLITGGLRRLKNR